MARSSLPSGGWRADLLPLSNERGRQRSGLSHEVGGRGPLAEANPKRTPRLSNLWAENRQPGPACTGKLTWTLQDMME